MSLDPSIASGAVLLTRSASSVREGGIELAVWHAIDSPRTFPEVVQAVAGTDADVAGVVERLIARGLIEPIADADD
jgi:hypothetical protein